MVALAAFSCFEPFTNEPADELAELIATIAPVPDSRVFFTSSGSEAVDSAIKLARVAHVRAGHPERTVIISRDRAYHGVTYGGLSAQGLPLNKEGFGPHVEGVVNLPADDIEAVAAYLAEHGDGVAAILTEPVQGAGGVYPPPEGYLAGLRRLADQHGCYLIFDEVICGFGRLGPMFGCDALGYKPNSISVAKALSSAYMPIAGVMIPEEMYQALIVESKKIGTFGHGFTYSGHPVSAAVAVKTLEIYQRDKIIETARTRMPQFQKRLMALADHPLVGEARGMGMVGALELAADKRTKKPLDPKRGVGTQVVAHAQAEGLIVRFIAGDVITVCPPMIIQPAEIDELFDKLTRALDKTLDWAKREQLLAA
jgi:4-aminobutyrate--pyruvate transaminase